VARSYSGPTAHAVFTTDYTTTDNVTGLVWKTCNEGKTGAACAGVATTYTWYDSINACSGLNAANAGSGYAGRTDVSYYNTATSSTTGPTGMVYISMGSGRMNAQNKISPYAVRCVTN
jgi:hypothetical protein